MPKACERTRRARANFAGWHLEKEEDFSPSPQAGRDGEEVNEQRASSVKLDLPGSGDKCLMNVNGSQRAFCRCDDGKL